LLLIEVSARPPQSVVADLIKFLRLTDIIELLVVY
jgi:hypothetical protein